MAPVRRFPAALLGLTLWALVVAAPALHAWPEGGVPVLAALAPLAVLALAIARPVPGLLLFAYPLSLTVPLLLHRPLMAERWLGPGMALVLALALVAFLAASAPRPERRPRLGPLLLAGGLLPALLYAVHFHPATAGFIGGTLDGREAEARTLLSIVAFALWVLVAWAVLRHQRRRGSALAPLALLCLGGCGGEGDAPAARLSDEGAGRALTATADADDPVVAVVDGLAIYLSRVRRALAAAEPGTAPQAILDDLITLEVLAKEAAHRGLAHDAEVQATVRQASVRALIEREFEPSSQIDAVPKAFVRSSYDENFWVFNNPDLVKVTHILARVAKEATDADWAKAKVVAARVRAQAVATPGLGVEAFEGLVDEHKPEWPGLRHDRIDWFHEDSALVPEFKSASLALGADGDISELVRSNFGWHVIYREGWRPKKEQSFESIEGEARERAYPTWRRHAFEGWVRERLERAGAALHPKPLASLQSAGQGPP